MRVVLVVQHYALPRHSGSIKIVTDILLRLRASSCCLEYAIDGIDGFRGESRVESLGLSFCVTEIGHVTAWNVARLVRVNRTPCLFLLLE
jgi:hypothetical protein